MKVVSISLLLVVTVTGLLGAQAKHATTQPPDKLCQQALHSNEPLRAFTEGDVDIQNHIIWVQPLISVYSNSKLAAYIEQSKLIEMAGFHIANGVISNTGLYPGFDGRLYFIYKDETARQQAIADIKNCDHHICSGAEQPDKLKYIMMDVVYLPVTGIMQIRESLYIAPVGCTLIGNSPASKDLRDFSAKFLIPGYETILSDKAPYSAVIGNENVAFNPWSVLVGDLRPFETQPGVLKISRLLAPMFYGIFQNIAQAARNEHTTHSNLNAVVAQQQAAIPPPTPPSSIPPHKPGPANSDKDFLVGNYSEIWNGQRRLGLHIKGRGIVLSIDNWNKLTGSGMPVIAIAGQREHQPLVCTINGSDVPYGLKIGDSVLVDGTNYDTDTPLTADERQEQAISERTGGETVPHFRCRLRNLSDPNVHGITRGEWDPLCFGAQQPRSAVDDYCRSTSKD